jgi:TldD protein
MIGDLERLDEPAAEMSRRARAAGAMLIWRAQCRSVHQVVVRDGRTESVSHASSAGHGVHLVDPRGRSAMSSRDDLDPDLAIDLLERTAASLGDAAPLGLAAGVLASLPVVRGRRVPAPALAFGDVRLADAARRLSDLERAIAGRVPGLRTRLSFRAELDAWRVFRSDGSDVLFAMPRCTLGFRATSGGATSRHTVSSVVFGVRPDLFDEAPIVDLFLRRSEAAASLASRLPDAPAHPAGSFPLVIDYALAKGLAHEAFGHAAEADGFRSSLLARDGSLRRGERVGADHVSIVDEPVEDDHAWQPYSADALVREPVTIVDHGRLADALSDPWSAAGDARLAGAGRAESFRDAPQPRMSNIRIEAAGALPAPGEFEDYSPERVRDLLAAAGVLRRHPRVTYLSGYTGGQVNTSTGDFVFHCRAIHVLGPEGTSLHRPAIFSGSMLGALHAVRECFGPLRLDALGYCGKWGQSVPSSGGSHYFLVLDDDPSVRLGGA